MSNIQQTNTIDPVFEVMLKKFTNQIKKDGIMELVKLRRYYHKPSEVKREKAKKLNRK